MLIMGGRPNTLTHNIFHPEAGVKSVAAIHRRCVGVFMRRARTYGPDPTWLLSGQGLVGRGRGWLSVVGRWWKGRRFVALVSVRCAG